MPCRTFEDLFEAIDAGRADYILTPLENSLVGSVHRCYDLLLNSSLSIIGEIVLPVSHFLIAAPDADDAGEGDPAPALTVLTH